MYELQDVIVVHSFCPKVGRPRTIPLTKMAVCSGSNCIFPGQENVLPCCRNAMEGQQIKVAIGLGAPATIMPMLFGKPMSGYNVRVHQALGRVLNYQPELLFPQAGVYNNRTRSISHSYRELIRDEQIEFRHKEILKHNYDEFDLTHPFLHTGLKYIAVAPREINLTVGNIVKPFNALTWAAVTCSLFLLCSFFLAAHSVYQRLEGISLRPEESKLNFYLYGFCKITEPEPLPWFSKAAAGTMSVTLWTMLGLFVSMFYQSNLRAFMVTKEYEKPMVSLQDVLDRGENIWVFKSGYMLMSKYLEKFGQKNSVNWKIAQIFERERTLYTPALRNSDGTSGYPPKVVKEIVKEDAAVLTAELSFPYTYKRYSPLLPEGSLQMTKDYAFDYHLAILTKKFSPATEDVSRVVLMIAQSGIVSKYVVEYLPSSALLKPDAPRVGLRPMTVKQLITAFLFLGGGLAVSSVFLYKDLMGLRRRRRANAKNLTVISMEGKRIET